jgi:small subunit ribosomal protein S18e
MSYIIEKASEFKFIHRILNTNVDGKRRVPFALRGIRCIGRRFATIICKVGRIDPQKRAGELTDAEC